MRYGELLTEAVAIGWRTRYLWFFGFFAGGGFGFPSFNFNVSDFDSSDLGPPMGRDPFRSPPEFDTSLLITIGAVVVVVLLVLFVFSVLAQGALADSVAAIKRGEQRSFGAAWRSGRASFWRVLRLMLLLIAVGIAFVILVGAPLVGIVLGVFALTDAEVTRTVVAVIAGLIGILALIGFSAAVQVIGAFALRRLILEGGRARDGLRAGYDLAREKIGRSLILWLLSLAISIGGVIALVIGVLLAALILAIPAIALLVGGIQTGAIIAGILAALALIPLLFAAGGLLGTIIHSYWTLAYLQIIAPGGAAGAAPAPVSA